MEKMLSICNKKKKIFITATRINKKHYFEINIFYFVLKQFIIKEIFCDSASATKLNTNVFFLQIFLMVNFLFS